MRRLILTGDDFGLAVPVNEAIVTAHQKGGLTAASLMVSAPAAADAVARAGENPALRVGLHLVLVEGRPALPADRIPALVDNAGELPPHLFRSGVRFFFRPRVREQLEMEIRAQFEAFRRTGLPLDHVNAHNHMHLHPTVFGLILKVGRDFGMRAVRLPYEPPVPSWRASRRAPFAKCVSWLALSPWIRLMKHRLRSSGVKHNDFVFGMADSGRMTADLLLRFLRRLPTGVTEIYFHPASARCPEVDRTMPGYRHLDEFRALTSDSLAHAIRVGRIRKIAFGDL